MPIRFPCPHCKQKLSVSSRKAGVRVACPNCKKPLKIPQPPAKAEGTVAAESPDHPRVKPRTETKASQPDLAEVERPAEQAATAPPAREPVSAPDYDEPAAEAASDDDANVFAQFAFDDDTELVYDTSEPAEDATQSATIDYDRVSVPRLVIYTQGALLGIVGLVCFSIGLLAGSAFSRPRRLVPSPRSRASFPVRSVIPPGIACERTKEP